MRMPPVPLRPAVPWRIVACLFLLAAAPVFSLDWPVANAIITGTFGEDRGDHFHNGIDIGGGDQEVHAVLPGELVFRYDEASDFTSLPRGIGSTVVLHHSQDILSLYCHLANGTLGPVHARYSPADRIGIIGDSGHANGKHLHFSVYDAEAGSYVNPLAFLPPLADRQPPVVRRILLGAGDQRQPLEDGAVVKPGRFEVFAEVYDLREDVQFSWTLAPYSVSLALDGAGISRIAFDSLQVKQGMSVIGGIGLSRDEVYAPDGLIRCGTVEVRSGESRLRLTARDFAGNETVKEIGFFVHN